jgi:MFS family permease
MTEIQQTKLGALQRWWTVAVLTIAYLLSIIDRHVLTLLVEPIKGDLQISDTELGLLTGAAFGVAYAVGGLPLGRLADRWSRKKVIIAGVVTWSLMTISCGLSRTFGVLFVARMGVGVGEAALTPASHAIIASSFPPGQVARAMSVFQLGAFFGLGAALLLGGAIVGWLDSIGEVSIPGVGTMAVWQSALVLVGLLTLVWIVPLLTIADPRPKPVDEPSAHSRTSRAPSYADVLRIPGLPALIGSVALSHLWAYGAYSWIPALLVREHGWAVAKVGVTLGVLTMVVGVPAALIAGWLADWLQRRGRHNSSVMLMSVAILGNIVIYALGLMHGGSSGAIASYVAVNVAGGFIGTLGPVAMQGIAPEGMRAQVAAASLFVTSMIGATLGSTVVALGSDFVFSGGKALSWSLASTGTLAVFGALILLMMARRALTRAPRSPPLLR